MGAGESAGLSLATVGQRAGGRRTGRLSLSSDAQPGTTSSRAIFATPIDVEPIYWAVHHNNAALAEQLGKALEQRQADGSVDTAYRRHMGISHSQLQQMIDSNHFQHLRSQSAQR